ncbi:MAG: OmpH family outer membrane protein [Bacteroidaceae bacterium]|nr:OmpH family outer membrane protein [Bacteroidaceae bacterium]
MKKHLIILALMLAPLTVFAQKFGHVNSENIIKVMPEWQQAQTDLQNLQKQFEDDLKRLEDEFTKKSEEYNAQQATLPDQIKERREKELQDLYTRMQQYYQESRTKLDQAGMEKQQAINEKILKAIKEIGAEGGYLYIFDVSSGIPFINETISVDVTDQVKAKLGIK